jgi:hypothetical protein
VRCEHAPPADLGELLGLEDELRKEQLPVFILAFDSGECCQQTCSALLFYLENGYSANMNEKKKMKAFIQEFAERFLGWVYDREPGDEPGEAQAQREEEQCPLQLHPEQDLRIRPVRDPETRILYSSTKVYVLLRMVYLLFERFSKARQLLLGDPERTAAFFEALEQGIRSKDSNRLEEAFKAIFEDNSYLFSTICKTIDLTLKYFSSCLGDSFTMASWAAFLAGAPELEREDLYFFTANKLMLEHAGGRFLIRLAMRGSYLYVHCFNAMYQHWEAEPPGKDKDKDKDKENHLRLVAKRIDDYVKARDSDRRRRETPPLADPRRRPECECLLENMLEYRSVPNSVHLHLAGGCDWLARRARTRLALKAELKRAAMLDALLHQPL